MRRFARFAHLAAVYRNFDWEGPLDFVRKAADLSEQVMEPSARVPGDSAVTHWFREHPGTGAPPANAAEAAA